jgi:hypothetical protein
MVLTGHPFRLSLVGPVTHAEFDAAQRGVDSKTGERLAQVGGRGWAHSAGWDMPFSAPKSVSVLWAVSEGHDREPIEQAHQRCRRQRCISKEPPGRPIRQQGCPL